VLEKNLVAQLVVQVRTSLLAAGRYRVALTRVGDADPNFEERASIANTTRPIAFLSFHAGDLGFRSPRVVVYTYQPPLPDPGLEQAGVRPLFVPWEKIQEFHLAESRQLAQELQNQLVRVPGLLPSKPDQAPARILRSVDAPAVAIEMGSLTPTTDPTPLTDPEFQHRLAEAVAQGIEAFLVKGSNP
jgi:N-acetylmuramoyl-L-alanine amidase